MFFWDSPPNPLAKSSANPSEKKTPIPQRRPKNIRIFQRKLEIRSYFSGSVLRSASRGIKMRPSVAPTKRLKKKSGIRKAAKIRSISEAGKISTKNRSRKKLRNFEAMADPASKTPPRSKNLFTPEIMTGLTKGNKH